MPARPSPKSKTKQITNDAKKNLAPREKHKKNSKKKTIIDESDELYERDKADAIKRRNAFITAARREPALKELLLALSKTRKKLPYDEKDHIKRRQAGIEQMEAIRAYLFSRDIGYPLISPFGDVISALTGLDDGVGSTLFKYRERDQIPLSYKYRMAEASAYVDYLCRKEKIKKGEAAKKVLELGKIYGLPDPRTQKNNSKAKSDHRSKEDALVEWAKSCKNRVKGKSELKHYQYVMSYINQDHENAEETRKLTPLEIVERTMHGYSCLKREDGFVMLF